MKIKLYCFCFFVQHFAWLRAASDKVLQLTEIDYCCFSTSIIMMHAAWRHGIIFIHCPDCEKKPSFLTELNMYRMHAICSRGMGTVLTAKRSLAILMPCMPLIKISHACCYSGHHYKNHKFTSGYHSAVSEILLFYYKQ